jgi:hypothetical protein
MSILNRQLEGYGYKIEEAISVDATLVEAHKKPTGKDKDGDDEASWRGFPQKKIEKSDGTVEIARRSALYCYKINLACSVKEGFISGVSMCKGSEHESRHLEEFITSKTLKVYADKGYYGKKRDILERGIKEYIQNKGFRGHPLKRKEIERNKRITKKRRIIEGVFGTIKHYYGWHKTKYVGLTSNYLSISLQSLCWNIKKLMRLKYCTAAA